MSNNPLRNDSWKALKKCSETAKNRRIEPLFEDKERFENFSRSLKGMLFDFSKTNIDEKTLSLLIQLSKEQGLQEKKQQLFDGDLVNKTENRAALHMLERNGSINHQKLFQTAEKIRAGDWLSTSGKAIKNIVHIGLGGSGLGPELINHTFIENKHQDLSFFFITNIDGTNIHRTLSQCNPEETLFIVVSKSFTTQETLDNSLTAQEWLKNHYNHDNFLAEHFIAITANSSKAKEYGILEENIFEFKEAVGGRFSIWSSVALTNAIAFGPETIKDLHDGASMMDQHFKEADFDQNVPILFALVDIWHSNFCEYRMKAVIPYAQKLKLFPAYLQQLEMESNGKSVDLEKERITYKTAPTIFGDVGTTAQHSFFQLLHQGTNIIPCDFIGIKDVDHPYQDHHNKLLNNLLAQSQSLMQGKQTEDPMRSFDGNRPSTTIILDKMDAYHLGMLIALYEHKIFVQSVIWNINAFDQFGVELGKEMALKMENQDLEDADPSTKSLYSYLKS